MAWPPSTSSSVAYRSTSTANSSIATLAWGTDGMYSGVILKSMRINEMVDEQKIEQGSGLTATQVIINDGQEVELTCEDDRGVSFPTAGATVAVISPLGTGNVTNTTTFQVINNNYNAARKQNGERVILAKKYTLITPS